MRAAAKQLEPTEATHPMATDGLTTTEMSDANHSGTVLVVDDEPHLVGMYASMLEDLYTVRTATGGKAALDHLVDDIDVVLLDRRMPDLSGDDVLEIIREERFDCRVAMVTSVEPDEDIIELPFDAYMVKPVRQQDLRELVENLLLRSQYCNAVQESFAIAGKLAALESQLSDEELATHEEYQALREHKERLMTANQDRIEEIIDRGDTGVAFRDVLGMVHDL